MGWLIYYDPVIDPRAECDRIIGADRVLKSAMVGSTYYAAVKSSDGTILAAVFLTKRRPTFGFHFRSATTIGRGQNACAITICKVA